MKLLLCPHCLDWNALSYGPRECWCGKTGGRYNRDGDTATVWGDGILFGFSNHAWRPLLGSFLTKGERQLPEDMPGRKVLWVYDESNGKITRLDEKPEEWNRPSAVTV